MAGISKKKKSIHSARAIFVANQKKRRAENTQDETAKSIDQPEVDKSQEKSNQSEKEAKEKVSATLSEKEQSKKTKDTVDPIASLRGFRIVKKRIDNDKFIKDLNIKPIQGRDEFNGNACRKILQKFRTQAHQYEGPNKDLFVTIANIEVFAKAETLKAAEVKCLQNLIQNLIEQFQELPSFSIGTKIHCILFHLIPFVNREMSWGIFSEQGIEAVHAKFTEFEKRKLSSKQEKMKYAFYELLKMTFIEEM